MSSGDAFASGEAPGREFEISKLKELEADEDHEDIDETLSERLWGLTEMFPEGLRNVCGSVSSFAVTASKVGYSLSRSVLFIAASTATIMVLPVVFETERAQHHEQQLQQQRQILLGPNAAVSGTQGHLLPGMMPGAIPTQMSSK
ncbi:mitochondrial import receptor subunit TOM22 homolog [Gigantopelta aegis]|uniref:mitochondrial import receptor subunit TOM22 homolog n=1 Tax=Gigantopelta aegis TaxID=1735272 RepID=UPI001B88E0BB|nr:mitochondrial import receptor subunit TOM22 homolog [Gigantopelta aegis]